MIIKDSGFDEIDRAVRRRTFGTLSTMDRRGAPHATAVIYAVSPPDQPLTLFVTTRSTTAKVHHIRKHPEVAFVIPVPHRLPVFPPSAVQFQGLATILEANDTAAIGAFQKSWFHRRILAAEQRIVSQGGQMCFIAIQPNKTIFSYGIGLSALDILRQPRQAAGQTQLPAGR
ncbi:MULTISPECIES: pyridoxamine 5'-phosphate oxidase family protein [Mycolicibacterium]|uniref:pyridoxamine 5'-phosphate oxidase family protein n=1 Tax=Mycolicibacterium TaxID=1866885 RepID=UPI000AB8B3D0|nr:MULTISPECIES: pyridoxamine 5'-phosphate oxidase family protein [Mycolicibacterium]